MLDSCIELLSEFLMNFLRSFVQAILGNFNVPAMYVVTQAVLSCTLRGARLHREEFL